MVQTVFIFSQKEKEKLRFLGVTGLILFGSQAQGLSGSNSDYDIGVLTQVRSSHHARMNMYDGIYDMLACKINRLVDIDIVFMSEAPLELKIHVLKCGIPLYESSSNTFAIFREQVMNESADFMPLLHVFQNATLARIP